MINIRYVVFLSFFSSLEITAQDFLHYKVKDDAVVFIDSLNTLVLPVSVNDIFIKNDDKISNELDRGIPTKDDAGIKTIGNLIMIEPRKK